jgi:hypothetical protein
MSIRIFCPIKDCPGMVDIPNGVENDDTVQCNACYNTFTVTVDIHLEADLPLQPIPTILDEDDRPLS